MSKRIAKFHKLADIAKVEGTPSTYPQADKDYVVKRA
jgi:hypothetical protein